MAINLSMIEHLWSLNAGVGDCLCDFVLFQFKCLCKNLWEDSSETGFERALEVSLKQNRKTNCASTTDRPNCKCSRVILSWYKGLSSCAWSGVAKGSDTILSVPWPQGLHPGCRQCVTFWYLLAGDFTPSFYCLPQLRAVFVNSVMWRDAVMCSHTKGFKFDFSLSFTVHSNMKSVPCPS